MNALADPHAAARPRGRIAVAADRVAARRLAGLLAADGCAAEPLADGATALARLAEAPPDLLVVDAAACPDALRICRAVRADPALAALPVLLLCAGPEREACVRAFEAGADDALCAPVHPPELLARVRALLRRGRRDAEAAARVRQLRRLEHFFSPQLARRIVEGGADDPLRSHRREITVAFLDLRGFTAFAERADPEEVMRALSEFHRAMGRRVLEFQGTLERFTGDGMMVFFNDPVPVARPARRAVDMALAMREDALDLSARWKRRGYALGLGIGIAQGPATVGAIGFEGRIDYGAIGPVTNLASRLCALARDGEILACRGVHAEAGQAHEADDLGELALPGFTRPVRAFRLAPPHGAESPA